MATTVWWTCRWSGTGGGRSAPSCSSANSRRRRWMCRLAPTARATLDSPPRASHQPNPESDPVAVSGWSSAVGSASSSCGSDSTVETGAVDVGTIVVVVVGAGSVVGGGASASDSGAGSGCGDSGSTGAAGGGGGGAGSWPVGGRTRTWPGWMRLGLAGSTRRSRFASMTSIQYGSTSGSVGGRSRSTARRSSDMSHRLSPSTTTTSLAVGSGEVTVGSSAGRSRTHPDRRLSSAAVRTCPSTMVRPTLSAWISCQRSPSSSSRSAMAQ